MKGLRIVCPLLVCSSGCAVCKVVGEAFFNGVFGTGDAEKKSPGDEEVNTLWRQGYGYNNPNPERIRKGLPPEDF